MRRFTLLFVSVVIFALATASVQKNLRFLEENERELDPNSSEPDGGDGSTATTTPAPSETTPPGPSDGTTTPESTEGTTTEPTTTSSKGSEETSPSATGGTGSEGPSGDVIPDIPSGKFDCYFNKNEYPKFNKDNTKFVVSKIMCNIPDKVDEGTTPEATTTPDSKRVLEDSPKVTIGDKTSEVCEFAHLQDKDYLYTCTFADAKKPEVASSTVEVVSDLYPDNKTTVDLGCRLGNNMTIVGGISTGSCPSGIFETSESGFDGKCEFQLIDSGRKQVIRYDFYYEDESTYTGCNCTEKWNGGVEGNSPKTIESENRTIGVIVNDFQPCKDGKKMPIECTVNGWQKLYQEESGCVWDNGAISSTVSSVLLILAVVFSIVF